MECFLCFQWSGSGFRGKCRSVRFIGLLVLSVVLSGCRGKHAVVRPPQIEVEALKLLAEGDADLREGHLHGWRQAEAAFKKSCELVPSLECKTKLQIARFLVLVRQFDEDIPNPEAGEVIHELCAGDDGQNPLCAIARWYAKGKWGERPDIKANPIFDGEYPELEAYFRYVLSSANPADDSAPKPEALAGQLKDTPLLLYLDPGRLRTAEPEALAASHPRFAEAFEFIAELLFQKKKYRTARTYFQKAIDLIPEYTRPMNGLGNIHFFGLEDYEGALRCYESTLALDPANTAALFGKGAALHKLGRYPQSNAALDRMLAADILRNTISAEPVFYTTPAKGPT